MAEDWNGIAKLIGFVDEAAMLQSFYIDEELPVSAIAQKLHTGPATITNRLRKCRIPLRPRGGPNNTQSITKTLFRMDQRQVFGTKDIKLSSILNSSVSAVYKYKRGITSTKRSTS